MNDSSQSNAEPLRLLLEDHWLIDGERKGFINFFLGLTELAPAGSLLQIEGSPYPDVEVGLQPWLKEPSRKIGRISRTYAKYSVPVTVENMAQLAELAKNHAEPEVAEHFILWCGDEQILNWYDAPSDPIYLSGELDQGKVLKFADKLGATITKEKGDGGGNS